MMIRAAKLIRGSWRNKLGIFLSVKVRNFPKLLRNEQKPPSTSALIINREVAKLISDTKSRLILGEDYQLTHFTDRFANVSPNNAVILRWHQVFRKLNRDIAASQI